MYFLALDIRLDLLFFLCVGLFIFIVISHVLMYFHVSYERMHTDFACILEHTNEGDR